jgi:chemotaxis protein MotB
MARKQYIDDEDDKGRWLLSYADFITLLFAFFVVLYTTSDRDPGRYHTFGDALTNAFSKNDQAQATNTLVSVLPKVLNPEEQNKLELEKLRRENMHVIARSIMDTMSSMMKDGQVRVTRSQRGLAVEINASLLFSSGQASLTPESTKILVELARTLKDDTHDIQVEGHTDDAPINTPNFPTNWELSTARASSVVRLFAENGVLPERMVAAGYGEFRPVEPNNTPEGRARNRRVIITLLTSASELRTDPPPAPSVTTDPNPSASGLITR